MDKLQATPTGFWTTVLRDTPITALGIDHVYATFLVFVLVNCMRHTRDARDDALVLCDICTHVMEVT